MPPKSYETYFKNFVKTLEIGMESEDVRKKSKDFATSLRNGSYDLYARKYHWFLFTRWCEIHGVETPAEWFPEGYWSLTFQ
jgi:hypothetical protein